jgi:rRNA maturation protein Nop10
MKTAMTTKPDPKYPAWVCIPCGEEFGRDAARWRVATFHEGMCGVCGEKTAVTEPRDFGHLHDRWQARWRQAVRT